VPAPVTLVAGAMMLVGLVGIAVPLLPGLLLVWAGVALWATEARTTLGWVVLGCATLLIAVGSLVKYLVPGRRLRRAGVRTTTTLAGVVLGVVGFFVLPVVGLPLGFALGVYLAESARQRSHPIAWGSTKQALRAIALSVGIELLTGLVVAAGWGVTVFVTR